MRADHAARRRQPPCRAGAKPCHGRSRAPDSRREERQFRRPSRPRSLSVAAKPRASSSSRVGTRGRPGSRSIASESLTRPATTARQSSTSAPRRCRPRGHANRRHPGDRRGPLQFLAGKRAEARRLRVARRRAGASDVPHPRAGRPRPRMGERRPGGPTAPRVSGSRARLTTDRDAHPRLKREHATRDWADLIPLRRSRRVTDRSDLQARQPLRGAPRRIRLRRARPGPQLARRRRHRFGYGVELAVRRTCRWRRRTMPDFPPRCSPLGTARAACSPRCSRRNTSRSRRPPPP